MNKREQSTLQQLFAKRFNFINADQIRHFGKTDIGIHNVICGLSKEVLGILFFDNETKKAPKYYLFYSGKNDSNELIGCSLMLSIGDKKRNDLTAAFAGYISREYNTEEPSKIFNTYQYQQRSLLERLGIFTIQRRSKTRLKKGSWAIFPHDSPYYKILEIPFIPEEPATANTKKGKSQKDKKPNFIYLMKNQRNGFYKIGRSVDPNFREKTLQAEEPEVELLYKKEAPIKLEKILHRHFTDFRVRGEWFRLDDQQVTEFKELVEQFLNIQKFTQRNGK